jgi:hypothetical protein
MKLVCCVCGKVKLKNKWVEGEIRSGEPLSHGYCTSCMNDFLAKIHKANFDRHDMDDSNKAVA